MKKYFLLSIFTTLLFILSCGIVNKTIIPGKKDARILLSNGWSISPAGKHLQIGDLPLGITFTSDEKFAITTNNGYSKPTLSVIDLSTFQTIQTIRIKNSWLGIKLSKDNKKLFVSGGNENKIYIYDFQNGQLSLSDSLVFGKPYPKDKINIAGIDIDSEKNILYFVTREDNSFYAVDLISKNILKKIPLGEQGYKCTISKNNSYIYVSVWGGKKIVLIDKNSLEIVSQIDVDNHPNDMVEDIDGKRLFVANANDNTVSVIDLSKKVVIERITTSLYSNAPCGSTPNSLDISKDGRVLYIANADNNYLNVIDISEFGRSRPVGFIPTGWYPTIVRCTKNNLLVVNGKGHNGSHPNIYGPQPIKKSGHNYSEYIAGLFLGSLSLIEYPNEKELSNYTSQVYENTPFNLSKLDGDNIEENNPIPKNSDQKSPIKYVFYVIKENRTYDQIFGDIAKGNGDPELCLFPEKVTPNHHKLANEFVLFDNFYVDAEVSADGHNWSMGAYATDYVEKTWPTFYGGRGGEYEFEGGNKNCFPTKGYLWDYCFRANVSFRIYGEFVENVVMRNDSMKPSVKSLEGKICEKYIGFDLKVKDIDKLPEWMKEFDQFEKNNNLPALSIIRLGNDHTAGSQKGMPTPTAMVADNDLAVGMLVERISNSKYWKESAIFILEDDAQNGPDHVDVHRSPALVISPFIKRGTVDSRMYSTSSVLRTIELILGLPSMSQYDAAANPFDRSFRIKSDLTPYKKVIPDINLNEMNALGAFGQDLCDKFDFDEADRISDLVFSEIIWKSVKGKNSNLPSPKRAAFVKY